ncbi:uncharacterized protein YALI1_C14027g [Yarrowia lipolytica]|uniref:Uncharacterized protein n=1 Tax=Yarrowia lipolytica TaxID=4952 RepID=A0A1D8NAF3_YARLL|nr:hypothetical protein YALI1_C14027g [Yarrowia lipolytica]
MSICDRIVTVTGRFGVQYAIVPQSLETTLSFFQFSFFLAGRIHRMQPTIIGPTFSSANHHNSASFSHSTTKATATNPSHMI